MEAPRRNLNRQRQRSRKTWVIVAAVLLVVILAVVIPVAVVISRRHHSTGLPSEILLPLYIYPLAGAWEPLYNALNATTDLTYTVVINPESGPGNATTPNSDFLPAIQRLNSYPNAKTVGYVRTGYGNRSIDDVLQDVETYSGWATSATGIQMHGIFFDEAPYAYSAEILEYMTRCNEAVASASGIGGNKTIIHNPGVIPDSQLMQDSTDITVVFEQSWGNYSAQEPALKALSGDRSRYSYMMHSVPSSTNLGNLVDDMSRHSSHLFVTNSDSDYYASFGSSWRSFTELVPT
nr:hypothetical protein B0A51_10169 [Rachicladosporium sp. CCFEE 5018]